MLGTGAAELVERGQEESGAAELQIGGWRRVTESRR